MATTVGCPVCGTAVPWNEASRFRPFCSQRCRTVDLGDWAAERHVIPGDNSGPIDPTSTDTDTPRDPR